MLINQHPLWRSFCYIFLISFKMNYEFKRYINGYYPNSQFTIHTL